MSSRFLNLSGLKEFIDRKNSIECKEYLNNVAKFFDNNLTKPELELALKVFFDEHSGTVGFLNKSLREHKLFSENNVIILKLWIHLIQNYAKEINFKDYLGGIIQCCIKYITSTIVLAKEREKAAVVLQELYKNKLLNDFDSTELITKCLNIFRLKNQPATFTQEICKLLGLISKNSPHDFTKENEIRFRDACMKILEDILLNEECIQYNILTGAMTGLNYYLINFASSSSNDSDIFQRIYTCVKKLCGLPSFNMNIVKKPFRAALDCFINHSKLFSTQILQDFNYWNKCLKNWIKLKSYEDHRKGLYATNSFYQVIKENLLKQSDDSNLKLNYLKILTNDFRDILENPASKSYEIRIAVRGFGLLSGICKNCLNDQWNEILTLVIQRTELISYSEDTELREILEHFSDYVQALSQMITQINNKNISEILSQIIKNITIRLIRDFHYLSQAHTGLVVNSLLNAFHNLSSINELLLDNIMEKIILEGVIWTCSHKLFYDAELDWNKDVNWKDNVTYKSYLPLWKGLIEETNINEKSDEEGIIYSSLLKYDKTKITKRVFNYLISTLFLIIEKLDLRLKRRKFIDENGVDKEFYFCDPNIDLCPVRPKDFHIFINLTDFYRDLFTWSKYPRKYFREWLNEYCIKMIQHSIKHPLISGFLKLLQCGLSIGEFLNYFNDTDDVQTTILTEMNLLQHQLSSFLRKLIEKCENSTGELQISCIELILKFPMKFYREYLLDMIPILKISLSYGKTMIWLTKLTIKYLENISDYYHNSINDLKKIYKEILPYLDSYLQSKSFLDNNTKIISYTKKRFHKRIIQEITETELSSVQKMIIAFLGKLEPQNAAFIISSYESLNTHECDIENNCDSSINLEEKNLVKWNIKQNIRVPLYLTNDLQTNIYLDNIVSRVCTLAITSSDRKTKICACELIHAIIIYLIGTRNCKEQMWKKLCECMLILGSDNDITVQQLFEPLLRQIIHFMSKPENIGSNNVNLLLDSLMNGISNSKNSVLRDLSAALLREFVEWSIKQIPRKQLAASSVSIEIILSNLKMFSFDSNSSKRNGSALAFNNLYRILRENETICDIYFIDLFYTFCINFKLSEELNSNSSTIFNVNIKKNSDNIITHNSDLELISLSLNHVVRVLKERSYLFNRINSKRIIPKTMKTGTLLECVQFLFNELNSKLINYRYKCIEMIEILVKCVDKFSSLSLFIKNYLNEDLLYEICEGTENGIGILVYPNLSHIRNANKDILPHLLVYSWLEQFLRSLDLYCWLLNADILYNPEILLKIKRNKIFNVITYYWDEIYCKNMYEILESINPELLNTETTETIINSGIEEINKIKRIKFMINIRIMNFLLELIKFMYNNNYNNYDLDKMIPNEFWIHNDETFIKFLTQIIYESHLYFDILYSNESITYKQLLSDHIENLFKTLFSIDLSTDVDIDTKNKANLKKFIKKLKLKLKDEFITRLKSITDVVKDVIISNICISEQHFSNIYGIEFTLKFESIVSDNNDDNSEYIKMFMNTTAKKLLSDLFTGIKQEIFNKDYIVELSSNMKRFLNYLMKICFMMYKENDNILINNIIDHILNDTKLYISNTTNTIKYGEHFYMIYKKAIFDQCKTDFVENMFRIFFMKINKDNFHYIHRIIMEILEILYKYRINDHECIENITNIILLNIGKFLTDLNDINEDLICIEIILELAKITPNLLITFKDKTPTLKEWIINRLENDKILLDHKSRIIYLLPLLINSNDIENIEITNILENLQRKYFPLKSKEFRKGSLEEQNLKSIFRALLDALIISKSFIILDFIIKCTAPDPDHILEWMIRKDLKIVVSDLNSRQQIDWLNKILKMINNKNLEPEIRKTITERFLIIIIQNSNEDTLMNFYAAEIKNIEKLIDINYSFCDNSYDIQHALVDRIIGFILIEMMYSNISKEKLSNKECPILKAYYINNLTLIETGNELIGVFTRKSYNARKDIFQTDQKDVKEYFRLYQCAAYRTMCTIVSNTQTDLKFYEKLLFMENSKKNECIWGLLINKDECYEFDDQEFERILDYKERFVSIRKLNPSQNSSKTSPLINDEILDISSKLLRTQNVFQSSLSQDVSKIDFNNSLIRTDAEILSKLEHKSINMSVILKRYEINKHEIMSTLCAVIQHMYANKITPIPDNMTIKRSYQWINSIAEVMLNSQNHKNIRIFLAQLINNCRNVFENYTYAVFHSILEVLVDECAGSKLNYFVADLVTLLLSWSAKNLYKPKTPNEIRSSSLLLKFLIKNAWHERREIYKFNVELIKVMITLWKDILSIPYQLLYDMITKSTCNTSKLNECGIIIIDLILKEDIIPWTEITKNDFIKAIFNNLNNENDTIYLPSAQIIGMIFNKLLENDDNNLNLWKVELSNKLDNLKNKKDDNSEKIFINILYAVQKYYSNILNSYYKWIMYKIPKAIHVIKCLYLEMFLSIIENYDNDSNDNNIYDILISIGITDLLKNYKYQIYSLHIINRSITKLFDNEIENLLPIIETECYQSKNIDIRDITYEILINVSKKFNTNSNLQKYVNRLLLKGLKDSDTKIQKRIYQYWSKESNLSTLNVYERILALLLNFNNDYDKEFLGFCTQLLLDIPIINSNSKRQLFEYETDDNESKLREYKINTMSRINLTIPPLFAESQQLRHNFLITKETSLLSINDNTQLCNFICDNQTNSNPFFEPTQDPNKMLQVSKTFTLPVSNSLPFTIQPQILNRKSQKLSNFDMNYEGNDVNETEQNIDEKINNIDGILKSFRGLLKDKEKENRLRILRYLDYKNKKENHLDIDKKSEEGKITLYRRYRYGDYPDFLINGLAILLPLQGLTQNDSILARQIFVSIFNAVVNEMSTNELKDIFLKSVNKQIQDILENSKICESITFATFMEIALLKPKYFDFKPEKISVMSKANNMLTIGAIYLENRLNSIDWDCETVSSRTNSTTSNEDNHWLHLSDIYNYLAEYDIVASIFSDKIKTDPRLSEAIELKSNGMYEDAQKKLLEVIKNGVLIEHYYAYNCYFDCYIELGDWRKLFDSIVEQVDDLNELWDDDYNYRFLLPKLMQSEVHLTLQGKNHSKDFLKILEEWCKDTNKLDIKTEFCEELMMLYLSNGNYHEARVYCENYIKSFLFEWNIISSLYDKLRLQNLLNVQKVAEIDHYALLLLNDFNEKSIDLLNDRWRNCIIEPTDSLRFWNTVIAYRTYITALVIFRLENLQTEEISTENIRNTLFNMNLQFFNAAIHQKNLSLVDKTLRCLTPSEMYNDDKKLLYNISKVKYMILNSQRYQQIVNLSENEQKNCLEIMENAWIQIDNILNDEKINNFIQLKIDLFKLDCQVGEEILKILNRIQINNKDINVNVKEILERLKSRANEMNDNELEENLYQCIFNKSLWSLNESINLVNSILENSDQIIMNNMVNLCATIYYNLAQFCYDHYTNEKINNNIEIEKLLIKSVLNAMKYNSVDAKQLFPHILQLSPMVYDQSTNDFILSSINNIPEWMYLTWIPQLLSHLKFDKCTFIDNIIIRIAKCYPNAISYSFNLWCDRYSKQFYKFNRQQQLEEEQKNKKEKIILRDEILKIINLLNNPLYDKLIDNLKILCIPEQFLLSHIDSFLKDMKENQTKITQKEYIENLDMLIFTIFHKYKNIQGRYYRNIKVYEEIFEKLKEFNNLTDESKIRNNIQQLRMKISLKMQEKFRNKNKIENIELENISPWLSSYQWCGEENFLELPGQYYNVNDKKPNLAKHIKIFKFDQNIKVFDSLRWPLKLKIYGSNGKSYDFLIKFGEDLKQDQRIQQILNIMSDKLKLDQHCKNHKLFIKTFNVVPIDRYCGLISWVNNTMELYDFIIKYLQRTDENYDELLKRIQMLYKNFLIEKTEINLRNKSNEFRIYANAAVKYTRENILNNFRNLENMIDSNLLRNALIEISISPESYFILRNNFIKSLSTMNIAHWILGVGDRHLKNILINYTDATLIGIDFNYTFGTGTRDLQIPELLPFRLTPHLVNLMNPMGTSGFIDKCMVHVLRVFRNSEKLLLACMEIFIREPTIDWIGNKKSKISDNHNENESDSIVSINTDESTISNWEPKDRIDITKCKLNGYNPMYLIERELKVGYISRFPEYLEGYIKILRGNLQYDIRSRTPEKNLNAENQVKCLINLATDPAILGITYEGYMPWI